MRKVLSTLRLVISESDCQIYLPQERRERKMFKNGTTLRKNSTEFKRLQSRFSFLFFCFCLFWLIFAQKSSLFFLIIKRRIFFDASSLGYD